jgi:hypothetical protein
VSCKRTWVILLVEALRLAIIGIVPGFYVSYYGDAEEKPLGLLLKKFFERIMPVFRIFNPALIIESLRIAGKPWNI